MHRQDDQNLIRKGDSMFVINEEVLKNAVAAGFKDPKYLTKEQHAMLIDLRPVLTECTRFKPGLTYMVRENPSRSCLRFPELHASDSDGFDKAVHFDDAVLVLDETDYRKFVLLSC